MAKDQQLHKELLPHLFRREYAKMTAVLCRHFGLKHIEIAEDLASDTFLKAAENWALNGIPANPEAWLYTVAKNKARDYFKHITVFEKQVQNAIKPNEYQDECDVEFSLQNISDSQLAMIFAVCNPANSAEAQICLALQVLCGFSIEEIAHAFLSRPETIKKRLYRARSNLRNDHFRIQTLSESQLKARLHTVLKTLYLLFNEGYFSATHSQPIRKELCSEALGLTLVLTRNIHTNTPQTNALLALMCFQSSRLDARTNAQGEAVLFEEQDKAMWDKTLIEKGNYYLVEACQGNEISKYHLEAGIAYWHTTPADQNKWQHILDLYNQLIRIEYSPVTALNRIFALAGAEGHEKAIREAETLNLSGNTYYHQLLGYLYTGTDTDKAIAHYRLAMAGIKSEAGKQSLAKETERLIQNKNNAPKA